MGSSLGSSHAIVPPRCMTDPSPLPLGTQPEDANYATVHAFCSSNINPRLTSYREVHPRDVREEYEG